MGKMLFSRAAACAVATLVITQGASLEAAVIHESGGGFYTTNAAPQRVKIPLAGTAGKNRIWLVNATIETGNQTGAEGHVKISLGNFAAPAIAWETMGGEPAQNFAGTFSRDVEPATGVVKFSAKIYVGKNGTLKIEREVQVENGAPARDVFLTRRLENENFLEWTHLDVAISGEARVAGSFRATQQSIFMVR